MDSIVRAKHPGTTLTPIILFHTPKCQGAAILISHHAVCRMLFSSAAVHPLLGSALSGNPISSCMLLGHVGNPLCKLGLSLGGQPLSHRWQLELPTPSMASEGPDQASLSLQVAIGALHK